MESFTAPLKILSKRQTGACSRFLHVSSNIAFKRTQIQPRQPDLPLQEIPYIFLQISRKHELVLSLPLYQKVVYTHKVCNVSVWRQAEPIEELPNCVCKQTEKNL